MIVSLCERFHCLPEPGSLLEQRLDFIRLVKIYDLGKKEVSEANA